MGAGGGWPKAGQAIFSYRETRSLLVCRYGKGVEVTCERAKGAKPGDSEYSSCSDSSCPWLHALPAATAPFLWLPGLLFEECTLSLLWEGAAECPVVTSPASAVCSDPLWQRHPKGTVCFEGLCVLKVLPRSLALPCHCKPQHSCWAGAAVWVYVLQPRMSRSSYCLSSQAELNFICLAIVLARLCAWLVTHGNSCHSNSALSPSSGNLTVNLMLVQDFFWLSWLLETCGLANISHFASITLSTLPVMERKNIKVGFQYSC